MRAQAWLPVLLLVALAGCRPATETGTAPKAAAKPDPDAVERLRALGYVGFDAGSVGDSRVGVVARDPARAASGFRLFTVRRFCAALLIDDAGAVRNVWQMPKCGHWSHAELLDNGDLLVPGSEHGSANDPEEVDERRFLLRYSWSGTLLWKHALPVHHEAELLPDGSVLTLLGGQRSIPTLNATHPIRDNSVGLAAAGGRVLASLSLYDSFTAAAPIVRLQPVKNSGNEVDLFHCNSVDWLRPGPGLPKDPFYSGDRILVSSRHQDTAFVVDWKAKSLVWAWGQGELSGPHDASWLPNGHILIFDNGLARRWSRVVELEPLARKIVWEYRAPQPTSFFTASRGSAQRLANGNTLIAESDRGRALEVTPAGEVVWEYFSPFRNPKGERATIVRMRLYAKDLVEGIEAAHGPGRRSVRLAPE